MTGEGDSSRSGKKKTDCCECWGGAGIRVKMYVLLFIMFVIFGVLVAASALYPLLTMRSVEEKQAEVNIMTLLSDFKDSLDAFHDLAIVTFTEMTQKIAQEQVTGPEDSERLIRGFFYSNNKWNSAVYRNGFAVYNMTKEMLIGEFHELHPDTYQILEQARDVPELFQGRNAESRKFVNLILQNQSWAGILDKNESVPEGAHYPFYFVVTVPLLLPEINARMWLALFMDERLAIGPSVKKLQVCIADFPGNSVIWKGDSAKDVDEHTKGMKGIRLGRFESAEKAGGSFKMVIHNQNSFTHEGKTMCYSNDDIIYKSGRFTGTTYFALRDPILDDPDKILFYVRLDHHLDTSNEMMDFICYAAVIPCAFFLIVLVLFIIIYIEIGVMRQLDNAKASIHQIILERKALLEEYLKDDKAARDYYNFSTGNSKDKDKDEESIDALLEKIAEDTEGSSDELGLLMNMSSSISAWMERILQDKLKRLDSLRKENTYFLDTFSLLNVWTHRADLRFSSSYIAVDGGLAKKIPLTSKFDAFTRSLNLSQILGNGAALEMFKSFCRFAGYEGSLAFVIDTAWLTMMEGVMHSSSGSGDSSSDTSGSVPTVHGNISHSQIVRLAQTIFSTYIFSPEHNLTPIGLNPTALRRLIVRADPKGRIKYTAGLFKQAMNDVRHYLETDVVPLFKESQHFRALYTILTVTSQITFSSTNEMTVYTCPFVPSNEKAVGHDVPEGEDEAEKKDHLLYRLPLVSFDSEHLDGLVEEEKECLQKHGTAFLSSPSAAGGAGSSRASLPSASETSSKARSKVRAVSPFAALLPGAIRRTTDSTPGSDEMSDSKSSDRVKKSFALTAKKEYSDDSDSESNSQP